MKVEYYLEQWGHGIPNYEVPDLASVTFEEQSVCPVCETRSHLVNLSILKDSLQSSLCQKCGHFFHSHRPTEQWYLDWYRTTWDNRPRSWATKIKSSAIYTLSGIKARFAPNDNTFTFTRQLTREFRQMRILDVGCGYGNQLLPFLLSGHRCFGLESSRHRAAFARRLGIHAKNISVTQLDAALFGCDFDLVFANHVLEHMVTPESLFKPLLKVLKPGGWLAIVVPNIQNDTLFPDLLCVLHPHGYSLSSLTVLFEKYGFEIHRVAVDHQLSILGRLKNDSNQKQEFLSLSQQINFNPKVFLENVLGSDYHRREKQFYYCSFHDAHPRIKRVRIAQCHQTKQHPVGLQIRLRWSGGDNLPLAIERDGPNGSVPFWVK